MKENFVTIFDKNYIPQGLALYESLENNLSNFKLWVICVDKITASFLEKIKKKNIGIISPEKFETEELKKIKSKRSKAEYCWTLTPQAPKIVFDRDREISRVTYLDADMFFFKSPSIIFEEFENSKKSVLITEHDFDVNNKYKEKLFGKYIVQFIIFKRNDSDKVSNWWAQKCLENCSEITTNNLIGDQGYLNDWEIRFDNEVHVLKNNNSFRSTWNIGKLNINELVAWHFHGLRVINNNLVQIHGEKKLDQKVFIHLYKPYLKILEKYIKILDHKINYNRFDKSFLNNSLRKFYLYLIKKKILKNLRYHVF